MGDWASVVGVVTRLTKVGQLEQVASASWSQWGWIPAGNRWWLDTMINVYKKERKKKTQMDN